MTDVANRRRNEVKVVEEPLHRRRRRFTPTNIVRQLGVHTPEHTRVLVQLLEVCSAVPTPPCRGGQSRSETTRVLFERLDAEEAHVRRALPYRRTRCHPYRLTPLLRVQGERAGRNRLMKHQLASYAM
jgi:hypothetical protein